MPPSRPPNRPEAVEAPQRAPDASAAPSLQPCGHCGGQVLAKDDETTAHEPAVTRAVCIQCGRGEPVRQPTPEEIGPPPRKRLPNVWAKRGGWHGTRRGGP